VALGGLFSIAFAICYGRIGRFGPRATSALVAAGAFRASRRFTGRDVDIVSIGAPTAPFGIDFPKVPEPKRSKNRLHLDLNATDREQDAELRRLLDLGARPADVGQGEVSWYVLAPAGWPSCWAAWSVTARPRPVRRDRPPASPPPRWRASTGHAGYSGVCLRGPGRGARELVLEKVALPVMLSRTMP
jgi:hypothetical protein